MYPGANLPRLWQLPECRASHHTKPCELWVDPGFPYPAADSRPRRTENLIAYKPEARCAFLRQTQDLAARSSKKSCEA